MKAEERFGAIFTTLMVGLSIIPIVWMFQFLYLVPALRQFLIFMLLVPIIGVGAGMYGLAKTRSNPTE